MAGGGTMLFGAWLEWLMWWVGEVVLFCGGVNEFWGRSTFFRYCLLQILLNDHISTWQNLLLLTPPPALLDLKSDPLLLTRLPNSDGPRPQLPNLDMLAPSLLYLLHIGLEVELGQVRRCRILLVRWAVSGRAPAALYLRLFVNCILAYRYHLVVGHLESFTIHSWYILIIEFLF